MPYIGSSTSEKRSSPTLPYPKTDRAIHAAQQLFRLKDWMCSDEGTLKTFLDYIIATRTNAPQSCLLMTAGLNYGGSAHHRLTDVMTKHAGRPNTRLNVMSNIYFSSDGLGKYAQGLENYMMFFKVFSYMLNLNLVILCY